MAKKRIGDMKFKQIQVTEESFNYFHLRKRFGEPLYSVVDRILHEYVTKDLAGYAAKADGLQKINEVYLARIHELEAKLKEKEQTKLIE